MTKVMKITFNPFQENTYVLYDDTKECIIIDPGCFNAEEQQRFKDIIMIHDLHPVRLINTHCHIDHVLGNKFVSDTYTLPVEIHEGELPVFDYVPHSAKMYHIPYEPVERPSKFLIEGEQVFFGETVLNVLFTPGHSPASISFYCKKEQFVIGGDVLFHESIGRTDLPGGDHQTLLDSIRTKFFTLDDAVTVYPGHGESTTVGHEKINNPFLR